MKSKNLNLKTEQSLINQKNNFFIKGGIAKCIEYENRTFFKFFVLFRELNKLWDNAKIKNTAITNSPLKPAPSDSNFSEPEIPDVDKIEKALIKLV